MLCLLSGTVRLLHWVLAWCGKKETGLEFGALAFLQIEYFCKALPHLLSLCYGLSLPNPPAWPRLKGDANTEIPGKGIGHGSLQDDGMNRSIRPNCKASMELGT